MYVEIKAFTINKVDKITIRSLFLDISKKYDITRFGWGLLITGSIKIDNYVDERRTLYTNYYDSIDELNKIIEDEKYKLKLELLLKE